MDLDNQPSTSHRAKQLKFSSEKPCNQHPVTFDEFRKFTNLEEYVVKEMERSGPDICRINYHIRHKYYPIVYKKFYESPSVREKMIRRGLAIKPIPKFLKEKLLRMPGKNTSPPSKIRENQDCSAAKSKSDGVKQSKTSTAISPVKKSINVVKEPTTKLRTKHPPKATEKSKPKTSLKKDDTNHPEETQKITDFFSALKLSRNQSDTLPSDEIRDKRKRKPETTESHPEVKRLKDAENSKKKTGPLTEVNRNSISSNNPLKRSQKPEKPLNKPTNTENRRNSVVESFPSDDTDIRSQVEVVNLNETKSTSHQKDSPAHSSPTSLLKSPLPKRNRIENFQKPSISSKKSTRKKNSQSDSDPRQSSSDAEMPFFRLSGVANKSNSNVSSEIQDWFNKSLNYGREDQSDDESGSFLEEEFLAVDKLKAIQEHTEDVRNYVRHLLNSEIRRRRLLNVQPEKQDGLSKSKIVAAFRAMTFDDYKVLINADKIFAQGRAEGKTPQELTTTLIAQHEAIIKHKKAWPKHQHIKLSTLRSFLQSKGINDPLDLRHIPPRLLSFEETLEHTNLKEFTSLSGLKPPDSYKQLLNLCKETYLKCCAEGVWADGVWFTNSSNRSESDISRFAQSGDVPREEIISDLTEKTTNVHGNDQGNNQISSRGREIPVDEEPRQSNDVAIAGAQENRLNDRNPVEDPVEMQLRRMFESQPKEAEETRDSERPCIQTNDRTSEELPIAEPFFGYIPPSPALFQSSGESEQRTQVSESQQMEAYPPEAVFIPSYRSMPLNTEENSMAAMSVDQESGSQDPFAGATQKPFAGASQDPELRLENEPAPATGEDSHVLYAVVKKEPEPGNNTQTSYDPLDDSIQIVEITPPEPIVIEDEESAPELLDMMLVRPVQSSSTFEPSISPAEQSSGCMDTFVHAQQLPSNLSLTQSQLNPTPPNDEGSKNASDTDGVAPEETEPLISKESIKTVKELNLEEEIKNYDIDLIMDILKTDADESMAIYEQSLSRRRILLSSKCRNVDVDVTACTSISAHRISLDTNSPLGTAPSQESTLEGTAQNVVQNAETVVASSAMERSECDSGERGIQEIIERGDDHVTGFEVVTDTFDNEAVVDEAGNIESTNFNAAMEVEVDTVSDVQAANNLLSSASDLNAAMEVEVDTVSDVQAANNLLSSATDLIEYSPEEENQPRIESEHEKSTLDACSGVIRSPESPDKIETTREDVNDLAGEALHSSEMQDNDLPNDSEADVVAALGTEPHLKQAQGNAISEVFIGTISDATLDQNEMVVACNLEVKTNGTQTYSPVEDVFGCNLEVETNVTRSWSPPEVAQVVEVCEEERRIVENQTKGEQTSSSEQTSKGPVDGSQSDTFLSVGATDPRGEQPRLRTNSESLMPTVSEEMFPTSNALVISSESVNNLEQIKEETHSPDEVDISPKAILHAVESHSSLLGFGIQPADATRQTSSDCSANQNEPERLQPQAQKQQSNSEENDSRSSSNDKRLQSLDAIATLNEALDLNERKTYVIPAFLPITALKTSPNDQHIEIQENENESERVEKEAELVEVTFLINRRFLKMLPFNVVSPQEILKTPKGSIYIIKSELQFAKISAQDLASTAVNGEELLKKTKAMSVLKQVAKQKNTIENKASGNPEVKPKPVPTKRCQPAAEKKKNSAAVAKPKTVSSPPHMNQEETECLTALSEKKKKKASPKKWTKKPSALDFVPQKTHTFRSLSVGLSKKTPSNPGRITPQPTEKPQQNSQESNYNIEDASQAAVASSTASQILGTDCTYFESSQLLRNIEGCPSAEIQGPPEVRPKPPTEAKT